MIAAAPVQLAPEAAELPWAGPFALRWGLGLVLVAGLGLMIRAPVAVTLITVGLCMWAVRGPYWALQSLALSTVIKFLNPDLVVFPPGSGSLFWLVILVAVLRLLPCVNGRNFGLVGPVLLFSVVALITSLISSKAPVVSLMKVFSFALIITATLAGAAELSDAQLQKLLKWLLTLSTLVLALSIATLVRPEIAYEINTRLVHGIINQPQSLGIVAAPIVSALLAVFLLDSRGMRLTHVALTVAMCAAMLLTQARTAAIAATLGVAAAVIASQVSGSRVPRGNARLQRAVLGLILIALAALIVEVSTGKMAAAVQSFALKRGTPDGVKDALLDSRGFGAIAEFQHFLDRPLTGNGFGVYPNGQFPVGVVMVAGIPISAPVEKGFLPTAVLEETGLFGAAALAYLIAGLARRVWRSPSPPLIAAFFACLFINIGEDNLLAPGGLGFYLWLIIALAVRSGSSQRQAASTEPVAAQTAAAAAAPYSNLMY